MNKASGLHVVKGYNLKVIITYYIKHFDSMPGHF